MRLNELLGFNDIAIQCHDFPDADTVASGYAVYKYLSLHGKTPLLFYSGRGRIQKANMKIMTENLDIPIKYLTELDHSPELLLTVDCVYGESNVSHFDAENIAAIDHHICRGTPPEMNEIRSSYGSCSSVIRQMLIDEGLDVNKNTNVATALYYGLFMDTNMFAEIRHPADKDLRDLTYYDESLILLLKNSNLTGDEMTIVANALKNCVYTDEYDLALSCAEQCDPNILGFISDLIIQINTVSCCVVFSPNPAGYKMSVRSCINTVNAADLAKYIADGDGGGHAQKAGGFISKVIIGDEDPLEFIKEKMISYNRDSDILYAGKDHADTSVMSLYRKKDNVLGFVPSCDIVPDGGEMLIRMLEADTIITARKDLYIMIGVVGEVYPINKDVFEKSYYPCDDAVNTEYDYIPSVIDRANKIKIPLTESVRSCRAGNISEIKACRLAKYTKVFTKWNKDSFLCGEPGDYLAVRTDDDTDFYIVKKDVFSKIYTEV